EVLGDLLIEELLLMVDRGEPDDRPQLVAEKAELTTARERLIDSIAAGVAPQSIAPRLRDIESKISALDARLRRPRREPPDLGRLHDGLTQQADTWRADLRRETEVARAVVRRLIGPLTLYDDTKPSAEWTEWETSVTVGLLDGLGDLYSLVASPTGFEPVFWP